MAEQLIAPLRRRLLDAGGQLEAVWSSFIESLTRRAQRADQTIEVAASYPTDLTITGLAATGEVALSAHRRAYPTGIRGVQAGATSAQPYGSVRFLYYDDTARAGGLVAFHAVAVADDAFLSPDAPHRHFVGVVTLPSSAAAANTTGKPARPPGYVAP